MNHELANELKEAGFPQVWPQDDFLSIDDAVVVSKIYEKYPEQIDPYHPTLSELIQACPKGIALQQNSFSGKWLACFQKLWSVDSQPFFFYFLPIKYRVKYRYFFSQVKENTLEIADTPEEAIAKLWLTLNKNEQRRERIMS